MSFPRFEYPLNYPVPDRDNLDIFSFKRPFPTNSWMQEGIVNNIADEDRVANGTPWYIRPVYSQKRISLGYGSLTDITTVRNEGNIIIQEAPKQLIALGVKNTEHVVMDDLTDLSVKFVYEDNIQQIAEVNYARGSPSVNMTTFNSSVIFKFLSGLTRLEKISDEIYELDGVISNQSTLTADLVQNESNPEHYFSDNMGFYNGVNPIEASEVEIELGNNSEGTNTIRIFFNFENEQFFLIMSVNAKSASFLQIPQNYTHEIQSENNRIGFILTNTVTGSVASVNVYLDTQVATVSRVVQVPVRWYLYSNARSLILDKTISTVTTFPFNGYFNVSFAGKILENGDIDYFGQVYSQNEKFFWIRAFANTITSGNVIISSNRFTYSYNSEGTLFLPPHLVNSDIFTSQNIEPYGGDNNIIWPSISYGDIKLYTIRNFGIIFTVDDFELPTFPNTEIFPEYVSSIVLHGIILYDINRSTDDLTDGSGELRTDLNPYTYGTIIFNASRVLYFATKLRDYINLDQQILVDFTLLVRNSLLLWITSDPSWGIYRLVRESSEWSGIIVPADSLFDNDQGSGTAFGNSYYNDHHFQYGYVVYALAILEELDIGLFPGYRDNILDIVFDYANPDDNTYPRLRHKDLFYGHSWATGVTGKPTDTPGTVGAGPVNRQQESSGEAINSYFAAYLFATTTRNTRLQNSSKIALLLEMEAARYYYFYQSPNSRIGDLINTGSIGIMQTLGKSFTLDWPMQPPTFPARSFGIYGIQTVPFTEITANYLSSDIKQSFTINPEYIADSPYVVNMAENGMNADIIESVIRETYTPNPPANFQRENANVSYLQEDGTYWGNIALQLLSFNKDLISDARLFDLFALIIVKITGDEVVYKLKEFDSITNAFYILINTRRSTIPNINIDNLNYVRKAMTWNNVKFNININRHITPLAVLETKPKKLTYNKSIESDSSTSGFKEDGKDVISSISKSKLEQNKNKYKHIYKYKCKQFEAILTVIRSKCAQLKIKYDNKTMIITNKDLPYKFPNITNSQSKHFIQDEESYCNKISLYIIFYHAHKYINVSSIRKNKYMNDDYHKFISQYHT